MYKRFSQFLQHMREAARPVKQPFDKSGNHNARYKKRIAAMTPANFSKRTVRAIQASADHLTQKRERLKRKQGRFPRRILPALDSD